MTANINVISDTHTNVLLIPKSAVIQNNNKYFVMVDNGNGKRKPKKLLSDLKTIKILKLTSD